MWDPSGPRPPHHRRQPQQPRLVLYAQGDLDGARPLYERALAIREARLGPDHPNTMRSQQALVAVLTELDDRS